VSADTACGLRDALDLLEARVTEVVLPEGVASEASRRIDEIEQAVDNLDDRVAHQRQTIPRICHSERSEESQRNREILRYAQNDSVMLAQNHSPSK
jgi:hypothetical protein